ncbi:UNVERIFIED_CONTAM: 3'5'-cyclic nucleotide phosphodiesterase domain-containing protein [Hammondia hammondi]|eukprot:XP_008884542.1 3'5'-cyclic nucleotide phosphodiesterase domain-containing protein [Hammondia hammondi]
MARDSPVASPTHSGVFGSRADAEGSEFFSLPSVSPFPRTASASSLSRENSLVSSRRTSPSVSPPAESPLRRLVRRRGQGEREKETVERRRLRERREECGATRRGPPASAATSDCSFPSPGDRRRVQSSRRSVRTFQGRSFSGNHVFTEAEREGETEGGEEETEGGEEETEGDEEETEGDEEETEGGEEETEGDEEETEGGEEETEGEEEETEGEEEETEGEEEETEGEEEETEGEEYDSKRRGRLERRLGRRFVIAATEGGRKREGEEATVLRGNQGSWRQEAQRTADSPDCSSSSVCCVGGSCSTASQCCACMRLSSVSCPSPSSSFFIFPFPLPAVSSTSAALVCPREPPGSDSNYSLSRASSRSFSPSSPKVTVSSSSSSSSSSPVRSSFSAPSGLFPVGNACSSEVCGSVQVPALFRECRVHSSAPSSRTEQGTALPTWAPPSASELEAASSTPNPTNSSRFARVKAVSFATLSECGSSHASRRSDSASEPETEREKPGLSSTRGSRSESSPTARSAGRHAERRGTDSSCTSLPQRSDRVGRDRVGSRGSAEQRSSTSSRRVSDHSRADAALWPAGPGESGASLEPALQSSSAFLRRCSAQLAAARRKICRAFQSLAEHDLVFRMKEDLAQMRHESSLRSVFADASRERSGVDMSERTRLSVATGRHMSVGTATHKESSAHKESIEKERTRDGGSASPSTHLSRSGSGDPILRRFPLKFVDRGLEDLFAENINRWMATRLLLMGVLSLVVTSMMWPLMAWSFNLLDAFNHSEPLGILFHINMAVTVFVAVLFIVTKRCRHLAEHAELIADGGTFLVVTIWGIWNTTASYILEHSYVQDVIGSAHPTHPADAPISLEKTSAWSASLEASSAVAYLYGLLLIVQLDVVYPSRTRRTWQVHLMFFGFSTASIIIRGALNPDFVPVPFVVIRALTYLMLTVFLFIGRHATELQQRHTFYNWLTTRKRMDRLESDLKRQREKVKVSTAVEQLVHMVKHCMESCQTVESEVGCELHVSHRSLLIDCHQTLSRCLSILTNTTDLYTVQFGDLDSDAHRDIIQAFLNNHNSSPADWTRVTTAAYTRGVEDACWSASEASSEAKSGDLATPFAGPETLALVRRDSSHSWAPNRGAPAWPLQANWTGTLDGVHIQPFLHAVPETDRGGAGGPEHDGVRGEGLRDPGRVSPRRPAGRQLTRLDEGRERDSEPENLTDGDSANAQKNAATPRASSETEEKVFVPDNGRRTPTHAVGEKKPGLTSNALHDHLARMRASTHREGEGRGRERRGDSAPCSSPSQRLTPQSLADFQARLRYEALIKLVNASPRTPELSLGVCVSEEAARDWNFDCLRHAQLSPTPLVDVGYALLHRTTEDLRLPPDVVLRFLTAVEIQYNHVPYHNCIHGLMVAQKMVALTEVLELSQSIGSRDRALVVVAGLCHDIGHPGRNNALFINALDPVAVLYNDKSVLENYHSCLTFKTLELADCDIFFSLRTKDYHMVRSLIIDLILATDMKNHFETVSRFRVRRNALDFDLSSEEDFWFAVKIIMKCADLSHCSVPWVQHFQWCQRLSVEFYDQGDEEVARHLPMSPLCDREKHSEVAKSQLGFMSFVAVPLFEELASIDGTGNIEKCCISAMKTNASHWEALSVAAVPVPLLGEAPSPDVGPPLLHLIDGSGAAAVHPGSKAAEIANRYSSSTATTLDLTCLVYRTQLNRARRSSQQSGRRISEGTSA